ncbi:hypothetical protein MHB50_12060 [Siminovitchia sp. FSL H7-0308]|uniref:Uncharacterized protein n=1 Tax=Siminovitchia thermophila TaxID=1245522 RepID=A0ABS2R642_9BACI|nr:hypothetical protein [Siminovitchia thermophila]MBM7715116.1 hypothetical protein [Siminovitchia thermophila]ONK22804.1 hypothetical protein BLX87_13880 [Bacillus sp. VT-16-64]
MFLDNYVNQKIQIKFKHLPESLSGSITGIYFPEKWCVAKLVYTEPIGIWVENPCYEHTKVQEEDGTTVPKENQSRKNCPTNLLIKWDYIDSIIAFPQLRPVGAGKETKLIGFHS